MKIYIVSNRESILSATTSKIQAYAYCEEVNAFGERHNRPGRVEKYEVIEIENMESILHNDEIPFCVMTVNDKLRAFPYVSTDICETVDEFSNPRINYFCDSFNLADQRKVKKSNMVVYLGAKDAECAIEKGEKIIDEYLDNLDDDVEVIKS